MDMDRSFIAVCVLCAAVGSFAACEGLSQQKSSYKPVPRAVDEGPLSGDLKEDQSVAADAQRTYVRGPESAGLKCRVTAPVSVEHNMPLKIRFEVDGFWMRPGAEITRFNAFALPHHLELMLTNTTTGQSNQLTIEDQGMPMRDSGGQAIAIERTFFGKWDATFHLVKLRDKLQPGIYACTVSYKYPGRYGSLSEPDIWRGTLVSSPFSLEIVPETPKTRMFMVPRKLVLEKDLKVRFKDRHAEKLELHVRNGFWVGAYYFANGSWFSLSGPPTPDDVNYISWWKDYNGGDKKVSYKIEIFETADMPVHFWHPSPNSGDYRVLWSKTYDMEF